MIPGANASQDGGRLVGNGAVRFRSDVEQVVGPACQVAVDAANQMAIGVVILVDAIPPAFDTHRLTGLGEAFEGALLPALVGIPLRGPEVPFANPRLLMTAPGWSSLIMVLIEGSTCWSTFMSHQKEPISP